MLRIGFGYDIHPLLEGRPLLLGGVILPFEKGLDGHSDADVLCHAIGDALLGAAALGDIGEHFPDRDPAFKGMSGLFLLQKVGEKVDRSGYRIVNMDSTVVAEEPKISPFRKMMITNIAEALNVDPGRVSIKATTNERLGPPGRGEAIVAYAVAFLETT